MGNTTEMMNMADATIDTGFNFTMAFLGKYIVPMMAGLLVILFIVILIKFAKRV